MIPPWLGEGRASPPPASSCGGRPSFIEKTLRNAALFAEEAFFSERVDRRGLLRRLDPRTLLFAVLALLLVISWARSPWTVWGLYLLALVLARPAGIWVRPAIRRNWFVVPLCAAIVSLPALCSTFVPGDPLLVVARLGESHTLGSWIIPSEIAITRQGVRFFALFVGRVAASTAFVALLTLTVPWNLLLRSLRLCRVPQLFVLVLAMTYRYLALLLRSVIDLQLARKCRTVRFGATSAEQRWVAARLGYLFGKSYRLSTEVHGAMIARGFTGVIKTLDVPRIRGLDVSAALIVLLFCTALLMADRLL